MADVALVIKIDEDTYNDIKRGKVYSSTRDVPLESVLAIANGTPLDDVEAEINELYSYVEFDEDLKTSFNMVRLEEVQRVIDKCKSESKKPTDKRKIDITTGYDMERVYMEVEEK